MMKLLPILRKHWSIIQVCVFLSISTIFIIHTIDPSITPSIHPSIYHPSIHPSIYSFIYPSSLLLIHLSIHPFNLTSTLLFIQPSIYLSIHSFIYLFIVPTSFHSDLHRAEVYLRDLGRDENHITNAYTILIIVTLVSVVMGIIYYLLCINISKQPSLKKTKRV